MEIIRDQLDTIDIPAAGTGVKSILLPATHFLKRIFFKLTANVNLAAGPAIHQDGLGRFVTFRYFHGTDPSVVLDGNELLHYNQVVLAQDEDYTEVPAVAGAQTGVYKGNIWRSDPTLTVPDNTMDDMTLGTNPKLQMTFNGIDAITPTAGSTFTNGTISVEVELVPRDAKWPDAQVFPHRKIQSYQFTDLTASKGGQRKRLDPGYYVRRYLFLQESLTGTKTRSNALLTNLELLISARRQGKVSWDALQSAIRAYTGAVPKTGVGLLDYDPHKKLDESTLLDLRGVRQHETAFDIGALAAGLNLHVIEEAIQEPDRAALMQVAGRG